MKRALAPLLAALLALAPAAASAQGSREDASAHFERGVAFFKDGDFVAAMVEFKKAYELAPNWGVLYNLGQTSRELREYAAALTSFERYLAEGGAQIDPERKKRVEGWIEELRGKVATVDIQVNVEGADVSVDDIAVGKSPLERPVVMNAGRRKIVVTKAGYAPLTRLVDVAGTEKKTLALEIVPLAAEGGNGGPQPPALPPDRDPAKPGVWPWSVFAVTAAAGTATAVVGGLAIAKKGDFDDEVEEVPGDAGAIEEARDDAKTFALAADVLGGITAAAGVVTIIGFVVEGTKGGSTDKATLRPIVAPGFVGVMGAF